MKNNLKSDVTTTKKCPKCQEEIQLGANKCKHCNADLRNWFVKHPFITIFIIIPIIISTIVSTINDSKKTDATSSANTNGTSSESQNKIPEIKIITDAKITSSKITKDSIGTPILDISVKNVSSKTIDAVDIEAFFLNNYGEPISEWNSKTERAFNGTIQEKISPNETFPASWNLAVYDNATKVKRVRITRIHFTDGTTISAE